jgi:hypothetical protein
MCFNGTFSRNTYSLSASESLNDLKLTVPLVIPDAVFPR